MLERLKQSSAFGFIIIKVNTDLFEKKNRMYHKSVFIHTMYKIATKVLMIGKSLFWEMHKPLKEKETFWQHKLKTFYRLGLKEKKRIFIVITHST